MNDESDKTHGGKGAPCMIHDDHNLLFAQRYGHMPLPNVMNYKLCKEFRDSLGRAVKKLIESDLTPPPYHDELLEEIEFFEMVDHLSPWGDIFSLFETKILRKINLEVRPITKEDEAISFVLDTIDNGEYFEVLSLCEMILRMLCKENRRKDLESICNVFKQGLAPYTVDTSIDPYCIVPVGTPENGDSIAESINTLHKDGHGNAHRSLREAANHINRQDYDAAVRSSINALESVALQIVPDRAKTLGDAIKKLEKTRLLGRRMLVEVLKKLWGYASDTVRHGKPSHESQAQIDQDEAVLVFCLCASLATFLSRRAV